MRDRRMKEKAKENALSIEKKSDVINQRREANRKCVQRYRERLKFQPAPENTNNVSENLNKIAKKSYSNAQTLGKAVKRAVRGLPKSPTKKKAVLAKIFEELNDNDRSQLVNAITPARYRKQIKDNTDLINVIQGFYGREDIAITSPKTNDVKEYTLSTGEKTLLPTKHMTLTVKEAHALFCDERRSENKGNS